MATSRAMLMATSSLLRGAHNDPHTEALPGLRVLLAPSGSPLTSCSGRKRSRRRDVEVCSWIASPCKMSRMPSPLSISPSSTARSTVDGVLFRRLCAVCLARVVACFLSLDGMSQHGFAMLGVPCWPWHAR
jgi:hypothetical protein